ncbi:UDP-N-acetylmuramoyl-tripeptide--D-alanyl-D-alanine ligase [Anaeroselena agilis]|uniref:UDP-N-acetylmuramoyl-tripeptide--D-alanyl-D-alanine ligase n=1 Tax=Anaeroselena agilis TaxID=3063788 RepID=A0ABU3NZ20_9FIRM|nr:UDP-N-acetylmuramoyl-tripeptide--D-alanyl-D-alanine ligase [Selenomonadales bacterium 4137-cl]
MAEFTVSQILEATGGTLVGAVHRQTFGGVSTDTRTIKRGDLFIALKGDNFDGHDFILRAVENGAAGVIVSGRETYVPEKTTAILVPDTLAALQDLARYHRRRFDIPVVGITGSNGKTTTKDMTAAVLSGRLRVLKTQANYNNDIGLPQTLLGLDAGHQAAVVEMGMRARGEISRLAAVAAPTVAVITNVGETHVEVLGSVENIAAAKGELVEALAADGVAILNADLPLVRAMQAKTAARVVLYGLGPEAGVRAENIVAGERATAFDCVHPGGHFSVTVPAVGKHNIYNALAAIAVGLELGLSPDEINAGLATFQASAMRLAIETLGPYTVINDAYNASPLSMQAAVETLGTVARGRKVAVLGDMLELGELAAAAHSQVGEQLADNGVEVVVTVGEQARHIAAAALAGGVKVAVACEGHGEAAEALRKLLRPGDTVLVKGSRGMKMEKMLSVFK